MYKGASSSRRDLVVEKCSHISLCLTYLFSLFLKNNKFNFRREMSRCTLWLIIVSWSMRWAYAGFEDSGEMLKFSVKKHPVKRNLITWCLITKEMRKTLSIQTAVLHFLSHLLEKGISLCGWRLSYFVRSSLDRTHYLWA